MERKIKYTADLTSKRAAIKIKPLILLFCIGFKAAVLKRYEI